MRFKLFIIFLILSIQCVSCSSTYYEGVVLFPGHIIVGKEDAFISVDVYDTSIPSNINPSAIYLSIENEETPDYEYLFYINNSGAYLVYEAMLPCNNPPFQVYPMVGYYNDTWYLLLDHSAVTFNVSPRRAIGLYRFNKSCLSPTTILLYNVTSMVDTRAFPTDYGEYIEFAPSQKSSLGFYFKVPKSVLNRHFGSNTTDMSVIAYSLIGGKTLIILPVQGAFKNAETLGYILIKPTKFNITTAKTCYSVIAHYTWGKELPYYGVLFYSRNGSTRFIPLLKYNLYSPVEVSPAPNVKPFNVPLCPETEENNKTKIQKSFSMPIYLCILTFFLGILIGVILRRRK